ncbi:hypothetical protein SME10J_17510 [Serratia marcescens]|nr:hypothetical protein SME10J_17430 [Serratia marcescens]BEM38024.1 hypothetical protein SME10J_17510 [Serratia marcescens]
MLRCAINKFLKEFDSHGCTNNQYNQCPGITGHFCSLCGERIKSSFRLRGGITFSGKS